MNFAGGNDQKFECHIFTVKQMLSVIYGFFHTEYTLIAKSRNQDYLFSQALNKTTPQATPQRSRI
jgi:hypothetical protein